MSVGDALRARLDRIRWLALLAGAAGLAVCLVAGLALPRRLLPAYLVAYLFWVGLALGCLSIAMLNDLVGGSWGLPIRRPLEAGAMTIVPLAILFLPIALGLRDLYRWADPEFARHHPAVLHKAAYLNAGAFLLRAAGYFLIWLVLAYVVNLWSAQQSRTADPAPGRRLSALSGPGLGAVFFTASFAAIDWAMSLEPDWYSTLYGAMLVVGWGLETFAVMILVVALLSPYEPVASLAKPQRLNDLGNLMLSFVMLWAYLSFSQFLIIWSGNLVEEIPWYLRRTRGGWEWVALALVLFHFFGPFLFLLFRETKRRIPVLRGVAVAVAAMHLVDLTWLVIPSVQVDPLRPYIPWVELLLVPVATVGIGGIWVWAFLGNLRGRLLLPVHDPDLEPAHEPAPAH